MRQRHPLRPAARARRRQHEGHIVRSGPAAAAAHPAANRPLQGETPGRHQRNRKLDHRQTAIARGQARGGSVPLVLEHRAPRNGAREVVELGRGQGRDDRGRERPERRRQHRDRQFRSVGEHDRDPVPRPNPGRLSEATVSSICRPSPP